MEYENFPIIIPSKNRPECPTAQLLKGNDFKIVVEPQDIEKYKKWKKHLVILPDNNPGLQFVRNFILEYAKRKHMGWVWVMDDDLQHFYKTVQGKNVKCNFSEVSKSVEPKLRKSSKFAIAALEYQQFAWSMSGRMSFNSYCDTCVALNTPLLRKYGVKYDLKQFKEDRDIVLQVLTKGLNTIRFSKYSFGAPENGSNEGGLKDLYDRKSPERKGAFALEEKWGTGLVAVQVKKNGRIDAKINWKAFKRK